jgi:rubrerythrin
MVFIELLLVAAILVYIGWPLYRPETATVTAVEEGDDYHKLLYKKDASLMAIKDLEFDYKTGKIDEDDYNELKKSFEYAAVKVLKAIDHVEKSGKVSPQAGSESIGASVCSGCGNKLGSGDAFCPQCGRKTA